MSEKLQAYFLEPKTPRQNQYEALRAYALGGLSAKEAGERFGLAETTIYALAHQIKTGKLEFFPKPAKGPKDRRVSRYVRDMILEFRNRELSTTDIVDRLMREDIKLGESTVERILKDAGLGKLRRRTNLRRRVTKKNALLSTPSRNLDFEDIRPFNEPCQIAGIFFFLPHIIESGLADIFEKLPLPESNRIGKVRAGLSFLALKLIGGKRLSHVRQYDRDVGFGVFAGLNVLPKPTYMGTYSGLLSADVCARLQKEMIASFVNKEPDFFNGKIINLDFHSIPHYGEGAEMEKVWCGSRNKAMKGANTFFAQDAETKAVLYANADVLRKEETGEILNFAEYFNDIKGIVDQTLVFDSRLTTYKILDELDSDGIRFITLRKRFKKLVEQTHEIPEDRWTKIRIPIPKRKYQNVSAHESEIRLRGCKAALRQVAIKDHGRREPTFVITNNKDMDIVELLTVYARRWRIENKFSELVDFFNLNSVSSPVMVRIHFDLLLSVAASFLYQIFAADLPRFENHLAPEIFRRFINMPGSIRFDGNRFEVHIRKRAHTPILRGITRLESPIEIPWLGNRTLKIVWRA
ncbi:MAG: transposase [Planctomycetaceae bacterium]|nr:transposase [Planctomycetaceae bacterium]